MPSSDFRCNEFNGTNSPTLTVDQILSLFDGHKENLQYFMQLREAILDPNTFGVDTTCPCDPRDKTKSERLGLWRPEVILQDVDDETSDDADKDVGFKGKQVALDGDASVSDRNSVDENCKKERASFVCGIQGCCESFVSLASYETHYHFSHNYVCSNCRRTFVSNFLLDIHLQENHDSYFQILSPRMDMFQCLVESCKQKFRTSEFRKEHLVSVHRYPASFSFHRPLKASPKGHSNKGPDAMEVDGGNQGPKKKGKGKERKNKVPATVCFGRGSQRAFQPRGRASRGRHWHQTVREEDKPKVDIEVSDFTDMKDCLDD